MSEYKAAFYFSPEDGAYIVNIPELPGCMADGETIEAALANAKEAVRVWIETAKDLGRPIPQPRDWKYFSQAKSYDVAKYILNKIGTIKAMALEKYTYYCKAWSLVWCGTSIVSDHPEAWRDGPVFPDLFRQHQGRRFVTERDIHSEHVLSDDEKDIIDLILDIYQDFDGDQLSDMTHSEDPWNNARKGIPAGSPSKEVITDQMIESYYSQCAFA